MSKRRNQTSNKGKFIANSKSTRWLSSSNMQRLGIIFVVLLVGSVGGYYIGKGHAETACVLRNFSEGSSGHCVRDIQVLYNNVSHKLVGGSLGLNPYTLNPDGIFGDNTNKGVHHFQTYYGLASDGIVGPNTWTKLCRKSLVATGNVMGSYAFDAGCYFIY